MFEQNGRVFDGYGIHNGYVTYSDIGRQPETDYSLPVISLDDDNDDAVSPPNIENLFVAMEWIGNHLSNIFNQQTVMVYNNYIFEKRMTDDDVSPYTYINANSPSWRDWAIIASNEEFKKRYSFVTQHVAGKQNFIERKFIVDTNSGNVLCGAMAEIKVSMSLLSTDHFTHMGNMVSPPKKDSIFVRDLTTEECVTLTQELKDNSDGT